MSRWRSVLFVFLVLLLGLSWMVPTALARVPSSPPEPSSGHQTPPGPTFPTDAAAPVAGFNWPTQNVELVHHMGGHSEDIAVAGDYVYLGNGPELAIIDVSDPAHPQRVGYTVFPEIVRRIRVAGTHAYVLTRVALVIVDIATPQEPVVIGELDLAPYPLVPRDMVVKDDLAYITSSLDSWIVDVSDPAEPVMVGSRIAASAEFIEAGGHYLYLLENYQTYRFVVLDITDPTVPVQVGAMDLPKQAVATISEVPCQPSVLRQVSNR